MVENRMEKAATRMADTRENAEVRVAESWHLGVEGYGFDPYLYNTTRHLETRLLAPSFSVYLWDCGLRVATALLHVRIEGDLAVSLTDVPFGGPDYRPGTSPEALRLLVGKTEREARRRGAQAVELRQPPGCYGQKGAQNAGALLSELGYTVHQSHVNHHLPVTTGTFENGLHPSERKRLRKCRRAGFRAERWVNPDPESVYEFLKRSRDRQGYTLSVGREQLRLLLKKLPGEVLVYTVRDGLEMASLTVAVRVNGRVLYNFCPADNHDYRAFSPMVMLNEALYDHARAEGMVAVDLGVSLDHRGREKASLIRFKENLGARATEKVTYRKALPPSPANGEAAIVGTSF